ncbi:MAG: hypothetical protein R3C26_25595 [Calditrichia bacterium]
MTTFTALENDNVTGYSPITYKNDVFELFQPDAKSESGVSGVSSLCWETTICERKCATEIPRLLFTCQSIGRNSGGIQNWCCNGVWTNWTQTTSPGKLRRFEIEHCAGFMR